MHLQMKAGVFWSFGGLDNMRVERIPVPEAREGQIRVKVKAAALQPADIAIRSGRFPNIKLNRPQTLGNEFAGVVDQLGQGVTTFSEGDEVIGWTFLAAHAEYVVVDVTQVVSKPESMSWEEASALSASGQTAHMALEMLNLSVGETLLVNAAAGGVGTMTVQLAAAREVTVIGTASEQNHAYLRSLGAIPVTYGEGLVERVRQLAPLGVDAAVDAAGPEAVRASVKLVSARKRIVTTASHDLVEELGIQVIRGQRSMHRLQELTRLVIEGRLKVYIRKAFSLDEVVEAHRMVETRHGYGKVVLTMGD